ncbi:hypothetical protein M4951_24070 [Blastopirellula sp. J2-11]|uniref:hypothetical protein n=1 Tax=Blastopirellula sp. J2-11 TaxID=2943192 RepID=UPI0021C92789|nr:hypothetical protein [Blastopirellula sp. J2-11]UUO06410.1 hypothetical protein M4951_24070 [Blastopirellula sp. J2-11]
MKFRFSMRTLFAAITLAAVISAYFLPGMVERYQIGKLQNGGMRISTAARGQYLLRSFVGDGLSERAVGVSLQGKQANDAFLYELQQFPYIEDLSIHSNAVTDQGLDQLKSLPNLQVVYLIDTQVTAEGIARLRDACPQLKRIVVETTSGETK